MTVQYDDFAETFGNSRDGLHWPEIDRLLDFLDSKDPLRIADIGCGNGRLLEHILQRSDIEIGEYVGVDMSDGLLTQAREKFLDPKFPTRWLQGNMLELDKILESAYDVVFFIASFHHLDTFDYRVSVLTQARQLLGPDGQIYMTNWNLTHPDQTRYTSSLTQTYDDGSADFDIKIGAHTRYYHSFSESEIQNIANSAGLALDLCDFSGRNSIFVLTPL